jgi:hypothetical protein
MQDSRPNRLWTDKEQQQADYAATFPDDPTVGLPIADEPDV